MSEHAANEQELRLIYERMVQMKELIENDGIRPDACTLAAVTMLQAGVFYAVHGRSTPKYRRRVRERQDMNFDAFLDWMETEFGPMAPEPRRPKDIKGKPNPKSKWKV